MISFVKKKKEKISPLVSVISRVILVSVFLLILGGFSAVAEGRLCDMGKSYLKAVTVSEPGEANDTVWYCFELKNPESETLRIYLDIDKKRDLACIPILEDSIITLGSKEIYRGQLGVVVSGRIPLGAYEACKLRARTKDGSVLSTEEFITVRSRKHPFVLATDDLFEEVKHKIENYAWAQSNFEAMLNELDEFQFPQQKVITKPRPTKVWSSLNYVASDGEMAFKLAIAYKLTGEKKYYDKLNNFIQKLTDQKDGYLSVGAATTGVMVHEGNFFLHLAAACDIIYDELSDTEHKNIVAIFRHYLKQNRSHMNAIGIMNHQASANAGAILVAIYLQDIAEVNHLTYADGGMADQISKGVMADGWWFESTVNYCYLVTQRYCLVAQAFENYGWDLYHQRFPTKYKSKDFENAKEGFTGMKFDNWGPSGKNTRGVEDMVTPYIPFLDENAVVVSSNDSRATKPDPYYELAYRAYGLKDLAWVLQKTDRSSWISLLYGVPQLAHVEDPRTGSAFAPNVGITALRTQKSDRKASEQIQAYVKYGTHGGWHGQFDRTGLLALDRNGHKYFGTEMAWFGYGNAGYKECVQTSVTHNMVVVDELQQEAVPSEQILYYTGEKMQVSVTQTIARWRKIPTFNIQKFPPWDDKEFEEGFAPVLQRRLLIVTDDYVVISDYMGASQKHNYDFMLHPVGLESVEGVKKQGGMLDTVNTNFESPYKYFTQGQWYTTSKGSKISFKEEGHCLDVYNLWPRKTELLIANYPNGGKQQGLKNNPERKTIAVRSKGKEATFLSVLEPYQGAGLIEKIQSENPDELTVYLNDGRIQTIRILNLQGKGDDIKVELKEVFNHRVQEECTK